MKKLKVIPQILRTCAALVAAHLPSLTARAGDNCGGCKCGEEPMTSDKDSEALVTSLKALIIKYKDEANRLGVLLKGYPSVDRNIELNILKALIEDLEQLL